MKKLYPSKIGLELVIPIFIILALSFYPLFRAPTTSKIVFSSVVIAFITYMLLSNRYIIDGNTLIIKSGISTKKIEISSIHKIEKSRNIISSPASSLDRLEVSFGDGHSILISPKDKAGFIDELRKINPSINFSLN